MKHSLIEGACGESININHGLLFSSARCSKLKWKGLKKSNNFIRNLMCLNCNREPKTSILWEK